MIKTTWKGSTEVQKSQIKGKESENSYQELKRSPKDRHTEKIKKLNLWHTTPRGATPVN